MRRELAVTSGQPFDVSMLRNNPPVQIDQGHQVNEGFPGYVGQLGAISYIGFC